MFEMRIRFADPVAEDSTLPGQMIRVMRASLTCSCHKGIPIQATLRASPEAWAHADLIDQFLRRELVDRLVAEHEAAGGGTDG